MNNFNFPLIPYIFIYSAREHNLFFSLYNIYYTYFVIWTASKFFIIQEPWVEMSNIEDFLELPHEVGQDNFYFNQTKGERESKTRTNCQQNSAKFYKLKCFLKLS